MKQLVNQIEARFLDWANDNQVCTNDGENIPEAYHAFAEAYDITDEEFAALAWGDEEL